MLGSFWDSPTPRVVGGFGNHQLTEVLPSAFGCGALSTTRPANDFRPEAGAVCRPPMSKSFVPFPRNTDIIQHSSRRAQVAQRANRAVCAPSGLCLPRLVPVRRMSPIRRIVYRDGRRGQGFSCVSYEASSIANGHDNLLQCLDWKVIGVCGAVNKWILHQCRKRST